MDLWKAFAGQNWSFYTHQKLYDMVITEARGASAVGPADEAWTKFTKLMEDSRNDIEQALKDAGASWEGLAAESMTSGVTPLAQWADDASIAGGASGAGVRGIGELFAYVSKTMPEPVRPPDPRSIFAEILEGQADADQRERAAQQARLRAIELMKGYSKNSEFAVSQLGTFIPPRSVTVAVAAPERDAGPMSRATAEFTVLAPPQDKPADPSPTSERPATQQHNQSTVDNPGTPASPAEGETRTSTATSIPQAPVGAGAATPPPALAQSPSSPTGAPALAGTGTATPTGTRTRTPPGPPPPGRNAGGTNAAPPASEHSSTMRSAGTRSGAAMGFGPVGAGSAASREEDTEHALPDYLRAYHDEFWEGDALPAPPVIGGEG